MVKRVDWFAGIREGKFVVPDRDGFLRTVLEMFGDKEQSLSLSVAKNTRSGAQNKYLWGVVYRVLSDWNGNTAEEWHQICKQKFLQSYMLQVGEEEFELEPSTTKLSKDEFNEYVESIRRWAAGHEVVIPEPGQVDWVNSSQP